MFVGVTLLSYLSVPQTFWQSEDPLTSTGTTVALFGPVFAPARVTEWWVDYYKQYSAFYPPKEQQE